MSTLDFSTLPNLPQMALLIDVSNRLWRREDVIAIWLGGSLGSGKADRYSDVDLRVAVSRKSVPEWHDPEFNLLFGRPNVHRWTSMTEEDAALHHVLLDNAEMYDLWIQAPEREVHQEPKAVLGCRDSKLGEILAQPSSEPRLEFSEVDPQAIRGALEMYWSNHVKNEKVIHRSLHLMARDGMYIFTGILLRLKFILATGKDCGNVTFPPMSIHAVTPVIATLRDHYGNDILSGMIPNQWTQQESVAAFDQLDRAMASTGREVAYRFNFEYPERLEQVVLQSWTNFKEREGLI